MKCPYRTSTTCETIDDSVYMEDGRNVVTHEEFEECYLTKCPFFCVVAGKQTCRKVEKEAQ